MMRLAYEGMNEPWMPPPLNLLEDTYFFLRKLPLPNSVTTAAKDAGDHAAKATETAACLFRSVLTSQGKVSPADAVGTRETKVRVTWDGRGDIYIYIYIYYIVRAMSFLFQSDDRPCLSVLN
jgi:hypothetical protein